MPNCPTPCPTCPRAYPPLPGDGLQPARFLGIAERPGWNEQQQGRVLVGKAGQEQEETYFRLAGLTRQDFRLTNAVQCYADNNRTPSEKEIRACAAHHIPAEIAATRPEVVFLLGGSACRLCPGIRLDMHHGIPQHTSKVGELFGWQGWVVPMFHPAIGLHEGRWMTPLLEDWENVMDELGRPGDKPTPAVSYSAWTPKHAWITGPYHIGVDTEDHGGVPFSVQVSGHPRMGTMYYANDKTALDHLRWMLPCEQQITLHNAVHDVEVLRALNVKVPPYLDLHDTMQEAFHLGNLPQGLKALVYRLFRVTMTSWEDTVRPASLLALLVWLGEALVVARADLYSTKTKVYKTCACGHSEKSHWTIKHVESCSCRVYTPRVAAEEVPGDAESLINRLIRHTDINSEYDPWERLEGWRQENEREVAHVESRVGAWPILGIGNCSREQAIRYAVGDADWTGQVAVELARRRASGRFEIAAGDEDQ